ncbi:MAG: hypothetical protein LBS28_04070 [Streptococcaceae bacterium]|nr:hypothetical protein [Streptococcaceae bacterium]
MKIIDPIGRIPGGPEPVYLACCCCRWPGSFGGARDANGKDSCGWCGCDCSDDPGDKHYQANRKIAVNVNRKS